MSAVAALIRPAERVRHSDVARMLDALRHRAPSSATVWLDGPAGLGQRLTREASTRFAGVRGRSDRPLLLAADTRLDERAELARTLELDPSAGEDELLLAAYERWGVDLVDHLTGDFAFVLWDARRRRLLAARDHFGIKPLYYAHGPDRFAAASEMKALLALGDVPDELDDARIADFLEGVLDDAAATFYRHIRRLPPAHVLQWDDNDLTLRRYWTLDPNVPDARADARACTDAFRETFIASVRARLSPDARVAAMLSGGLDSSSIACVARDLIAGGAARAPLGTISAVFPGIAESDERPFIDAVVARGGVEPHLVDATAIPPLATIDRLLDHEDEPRLAANLYLVWALYQTARDAGVEVALDGIDGDTVVSHGIARLAELARARRWREFATESAGVATLRRRNPLVNVRHYGYPAITARARTGAWLGAIGDARALATHARVSSWSIVRDAILSPLLVQPLAARLGRRPPSRARRYKLVTPELAARTDLEERHAAAGAPRHASQRADHYWRLTRGIFGYGFEVMDHVSAAFGIETRYPFFDRRLVELSLAMPAELKLRDGWTRWVLRQALDGVLPPEVQWRTGKADVGVHFRRALLANHRREIEALVHGGPSEIDAWVDRTALRARYDEYRRDGGDRGALAVWQAIVLESWLRRRRRRVTGTEYATEGAENPAVDPHEVG